MIYINHSGIERGSVFQNKNKTIPYMDNKNNNNKNNTQGVCLEDGDREGRIVEDVMVPKHIIDEAVSYTRQEIAKVLDKEQARFENIRDMVMVCLYCFPP